MVEIRDDDHMAEVDLMARSDTLRFDGLDRGTARVGSTGSFTALTAGAECALRFR